MKKSVVIIGGGVAGMSAAHELGERGFDVHVYERQPVYVGGKARSVEVPNSATKDHHPLPGEHGFRFFPGFYRHIMNTMGRIPLREKQEQNEHDRKKKKKTVLDNLIVSTQSIQAQNGHNPIIVPSHPPRNLKQLKQSLRAYVETHAQLSNEEQELMFNTIWKVCTSCYERRMGEFERISWWDFTDASNQSKAYQDLFVIGLTRTLVAAKAREISAKTAGDILVQLFQLLLSKKNHADQVLNAPTNDAWLWPWLDYLKSLGVNYHHGFEGIKVHYDDNAKEITGIDVIDLDQNVSTVTGDYYLIAVPVERIYPMVKDNASLLEDAPTLQELGKLAQSTRWMNGAQFYLSEEVPVLDTTPGHVIYFGTPWALTSISQLQFWKGFHIDKYGDGKVKSILSVDISNWDADGILYNKPANDCNKEEIRDEVWAQLQKALNTGGEFILKNREEILIEWFLDRDIEWVPNQHGITGRPHSHTINEEPLLVNRVNTWGMRPSASTAVNNLFLAGDYVQTFTDLATMEGANEAARRAVNHLLDIENSDLPRCEIWNLHQPAHLGLLRWLDKRRYFRGKPWTNETPWLFDVINGIMNFMDRIFGIYPKI